MDKKINNFGNIKIYENFELSKFSSFRIGGNARFAAFPKNSNELISLIDTATKSGIRHIVIGNASNVLFDSGYIDALIIFTRDMKSCKIDENKIIAECGCSLSALSVTARNASLSGLEFAYGIPGTLGGAVYMNAGAYGGEISDVLYESTVYDIKNGKISTLSNKDHMFSYRKSIFSNKELILISSTLSMKKGEKEVISRTMSENMKKRTEKQPLEFPSAGSAFKRPQGMFAAELIEKSGLKGFSVNDAQISDKHAGFIINRGNATSDDVLLLINKTINTVKEKFGVVLEPEIIYIK